jgi:hypothetical protein
MSAHSPLNSPLHSAVRQDKRRHNIQDLVANATGRVPHALGEEAGEGALAVRRQAVRHDALSGLAAALVGVAPAANVPSTRSR